MTRVRTERAKDISGLLEACVPGERLPATEAVVERIGVNGRDITFRGAATTVEGCDRAPRARSIAGPWCGRAGWKLEGGRVSDARLDLCTDRRARPVAGFAWINALPQARWIVVDQPGFREAYPVAGRLPVRVGTAVGLRNGRSARFRYAQYDARGVLLERRTLRPIIAS